MPILFTMMTLFALSAHASNGVEIKPPAGQNTLFKYNSECKAAVAVVKATPRVTELDKKNLDEDLFLLDNALKIVTDNAEETDFRLQVVSTAESFRQSLMYDIREVSKVDAELATSVIKTCSLENMNTSLGEQLSELIEKLLTSSTGSN